MLHAEFISGIPRIATKPVIAIKFKLKGGLVMGFKELGLHIAAVSLLAGAD